MPLYTKKEFADICLIEEKQLFVYKQRGKVVFTNDGFVDSDEAINIIFLQKRRDFATKPKGYKEEKPIKEPKQPKEKKVIEFKEIEKPKEQKEVFESINNNFEPEPNEEPTQQTVSKGTNEANTYLSLDTKLKAQQLQKLEAETRILNIKEEKLNGLLIPTDLVIQVFQQHSQNIATSLKNNFENLIFRLEKEKGFTRQEIIDLKMQSMDLINLGITKAIDMTKKSIDNIQNEFSEKRGIGERQ